MLVRALPAHNSERSTSYDAAATKMDLDALRRKRQFLLIRDYASAVLRLSPDNFRVRRQLGQALYSSSVSSIARKPCFANWSATRRRPMTKRTRDAVCSVASISSAT